MLFDAASIYPQGSFAIGTAIRPRAGNEYDVDLVCRFTDCAVRMQPAEVKRLLGDRLKANGRYAPILQEMPRCWRLNYANEFHLDITPSIPNLSCPYGGELVPDKALQRWKSSNPKGYRSLFERRAKMKPRYRLLKSAFAMDRRADIEQFPSQAGFRGLLRRVVQLAKRHRDIYFERADPSLVPISVIITTLASKAYEYCVTSFEHDSEFDLLVSVVRLMPVFIESGFENGRRAWAVWNETTAHENFAEKWNTHPERAAAFSEWHARFLSDLERVADLAGLDRLTKSLSDAFGALPVSQATKAFTDEVDNARRAGTLRVAASIGITTEGTSARASPVRPNTFFGAGDPS